MNTRVAYTITALVTAFFGFFFIYPAVMVIKEAFYTEESGFTLAFVGQVFSNPVYLEGLWNAFLLGITSTLASLLISFPLALLAHRYVFPFKGALSSLILIPLVLPPFVGAVGVKQMLGVNGAFNAVLTDIGLMAADAPIDWLGNPRTALWTLLTGAPVRVGYDLPRRRWFYNVKVPRNDEDGRHLRGFVHDIAGR